MTNIIETKFGTLVNTSKIAAGSASSIKKTGAFYNFSIKVSQDDIREYSFTDLDSWIYEKNYDRSSERKN